MGKLVCLFYWSLSWFFWFVSLFFLLWEGFFVFKLISYGKYFIRGLFLVDKIFIEVIGNLVFCLNVFLI